MTTEAMIRASQPRSDLEPAGRHRKSLGLATLLAIVVHLLAFTAASKLGWDYSALTPSIEIPADRFLELFLEVNEPVPEIIEAAGATEPAPEIAPMEAPQEAIAGTLPYDAGILSGSQEAQGSDAGEDRTINLEETAPALKSYNSLVRTAVARHWILPPAARSNFQPGRFVAVMTLNRLGQVQVIMVEESSGIPALDFAAMEALRGAAPYPPFPPDLEDQESLNIRFHFDYRAVQRRPGSLGAYDQNRP